MKFKIFIATFLMFICISMAYADETKIAKINLGLLTALHPKMALFDFGALGFYKYGFGLSEDEREAEKNNPDKNSNVRKKAEEEFEILQKEFAEINIKIANEVNKLLEKTGKTNEESDLLKELRNKRIEYEFLMEDAQYSMKYPYLTSPKETKEILKNIEKECNEAIKEAVKDKNYDVVLNSSNTVPFGYPISYRTESSFYIGPSGIDEKIYYAILSNPREKLEDNEIAQDYLRMWILNMEDAHVQKYLPLSPRPLVLQGGKDILSDVIKILYKKYNIDESFYEDVEKAIIKFGVSEQ